MNDPITPIFDPDYAARDFDDMAHVLVVLDASTPWVNRDAPRDECFMATNTALSYSYGKSAAVRRTYQAEALSPIAWRLMRDLNERTGAEYNVVVLNRYADQHQALGWHADDSPEQDPDHPIAVISFGASRFIYVRERGYTGTVPPANRFLLTPGSLFVMPPRFQETHQHKIPKHDQPCGVRISLTLRKLDR